MINNNNFNNKLEKNNNKMISFSLRLLNSYIYIHTSFINAFHR